MKDQISNLFSSLHYRNFRLYLAGQSFSLTGACIQQIAISWLLFRLTHSTASLGWLRFYSQIPIVIFITGAGVLVDRFDRRRLLLITQCLALAQALVLTLLVWFHVITPRDIFLLTLLSGIIETVALPTRLTLVPALLDKKEDLANAIGLINMTYFLGSMIAGWFVAVSGETLCFLINSLSYLATITALVRMRLPPQTEHAPKVNFWSHWKEGLHYAYNHRTIRKLLVLEVIGSLVVAPIMTLMPAVARALQGGSSLLGALMAALGFGALMGGLAIPLAGIKKVGVVRRLMAWSAAALAVVTIAFSLTRSISVAWCLLAIGGFSYALMNVACNTCLHLIVPEVKRGRLMSLFSLAAYGLLPLGSLLTGLIAERLGIFPTILAGSCLGLAGVLLVAFGSSGSASQTETETFTNKILS